MHCSYISLKQLQVTQIGSLVLEERSITQIGEHDIG
jgi:hypothetical protein